MTSPSVLARTPTIVLRSLALGSSCSMTLALIVIGGAVVLTKGLGVHEGPGTMSWGEFVLGLSLGPFCRGALPLPQLRRASRRLHGPRRFPWFLGTAPRDLGDGRRRGTRGTSGADTVFDSHGLRGPCVFRPHPNGVRSSSLRRRSERECCSIQWHPDGSGGDPSLCRMLVLGWGGRRLVALDIGSIQPAVHGNFYELYAIAAAVLGGCSLRGGEGTVLGVLIGAALIRVLNNSITLLEIPSQLEFAIIGAVILSGVIADEVIKRWVGERKRKKEWSA